MITTKIQIKVKKLMEIEKKFISKRICRCFFSLVGTLLKLNEVKLQGLVGRQ
jgi:hypothetical protein